MKKLGLIICLFPFLNGEAQQDFVIEVNDTTLNIALNKNYNIVLKGQKINFKVTSKDTLNYDDAFFSFLYHKDLKVSRTELKTGIEQITIVTAEGSGILIQKFSTFDPGQLKDLLLSEVTKESISYGYEAKRFDYRRILGSGENIAVMKSVLRYKDAVSIYELASFSKKDAGLIIMTIRRDENDNTAGKKVIDLMWNSIKLK